MELSINSPQVAVIVATKNRSQLLRDRALHSISKQTHAAKYLIIVDDSDPVYWQKNKEAIEFNNFPVDKVHYLTNQRTSGASGAWNSAIDLLVSSLNVNSNNLYLAFLDDDDEWHEEYLQSCLHVACTTRSGMVAAGSYRYEVIGNKPIQCLPPTDLSEDLFLRGNPGIQGSNLFIKLHTMQQVGGFDEHLSSCIDRDLCIRINDLGDVKYTSIGKALLNYYADHGRIRLSAPNSHAKQAGLTAFWEKYRSRMNTSQSFAFKERANRLFNWQPVPCTKPDYLSKTALTLGIELTGEPTNEICQMIESIARAVDLVGFNLVVTARKTIDACAIIEMARKLGITCYTLCKELYSVEDGTTIVASENKGYRAYVIRQSMRLSEGFNFISIEEQLLAIGAKELASVAPHHNSDLLELIKAYRIESARDRIQRTFKPESLRLLGVGSEAIVMTDGIQVYKCIDYWKTRTPSEQVRFLQSGILKSGNLPGLYRIDAVIADGQALLIRYPYEASESYQGGNVEQVIDLLHSCSKAGFVCNNIHPKNLIKTTSEVKLIDYGSDIKPWSELGFEHMARRAYLSIYYAQRAELNVLMRESSIHTNFFEMQEYDRFRHRLTGIDCNLKHAEQASLPLLKPIKPPKPFSLNIGVITADPQKLLPLLNSLEVLAEQDYLISVCSFVLCNGCDMDNVKQVLTESKRPIGRITLISETQQASDAQSGLFGPDLATRPSGQVGIAHARSMLQKYVGEVCAKEANAIAWILDDDMRIDARALQYLQWMPSFKRAGVDVLIGQYEGASPNPPINGLRGQLVDLLHNLRWLDALPENIPLPDRTAENTALRITYPDYYYDLSRKHTAHLETPLWLEPVYPGETVAEARIRLIFFAKLIVTGYPLTRSIVPTCLDDPLDKGTDSVNRGGNTFVLNSKALTDTPNLTPKINGREARRSDMIWAIINKHAHGFNIKSVPFPVIHTGRVQPEQTMNKAKMCDEIIGSAIYAGLQEFLNTQPNHNLDFSVSDLDFVWASTCAARAVRLASLKQSFFRIQGITKALDRYPDLTSMCDYLRKAFTIGNFNDLSMKAEKMNEDSVRLFLSKLKVQSANFS